MKRKIRFDVELRSLWCLTKMNLSGEDIARKPNRRTFRVIYRHSYTEVWRIYQITYTKDRWNLVERKGTAIKAIAKPCIILHLVIQLWRFLILRGKQRRSYERVYEFMCVSCIFRHTYTWNSTLDGRGIPYRVPCWPRLSSLSLILVLVLFRVRQREVKYVFTVHRQSALLSSHVFHYRQKKFRPSPMSFLGRSSPKREFHANRDHVMFAIRIHGRSRSVGPRGRVHVLAR